MKRMLFIFHAKAGRGSLKQKLMEIVSRFNQAGYAVTILTTAHRGHAEELVATYANDYDLLLAAGGDGTLNETVNGMLKAKEKMPIAYIPTGTTNDFAGSLGIENRLDRAIDRIIQGNTVSVDVGLINDERAFLYVAAFGTIVKASYTTAQEDKNIWGYAAYLAEAIDLLPETRSYNIKVKYDGKTKKNDVMYGLITNSDRVSGIRGITGRDVSMSDGRFEATFLQNAKNVAELVIPATTLFTDNPDPKYVERFSFEDMTIESDRPIEWGIDGEYGGTFSVTHLKVMKKAISFYV
ncbi:MAG: diacylglycerol kinase family lipid kinase [Lachnospiraceae bacterium]|nr:diacylglycerol kinase family lipid kinase [Lachnospiraceae bacterium]